MSKFNSIKKSRKKSKDIDEKIEYLDKECQKTGLNEITMGTGGMYQGSTQIPNQDYDDFSGLNQGGYGFGLSGGDGNGAGNASVGVIDDTVSNCAGYMGLDGVALSPPHPITGQRKCARTQTGFAGFFSPLRPGKVQTNSGIPSGGALWFFDPLYNFGGAQGRWLNFQWHPTQNAWAFWDTNFLGFFFLNTNLDQYQLHGHNIGTDIKNKILGLNFGNNGAIGTPQTTVLTQNDLGDPTFLPINIPDLSGEAFDYLKNKANNNTASSGVNYDVYNKLWDDYGIEAANWYENNPDLPGSANPHIPAGGILPLELAQRDSRFSEPVSDIDINPSLGAKPGDQLAFLPFGGNPEEKAAKELKKIIDKGRSGMSYKQALEFAHQAASPQNYGTASNPRDEAAFKKRYGVTPQQFLKYAASGDVKHLKDIQVNNILNQSYQAEGNVLSESILKHFKRRKINEDVYDNTKFNIIKKSRKKSKGIDEKIEYLNKECKKNNLQEIMTTSNMYVDGGTVPNQDYINFEGQSQGGYKLGLSAADGNNLGNAIIQNGQAFSPPHPVTGVRRGAIHRTTGLGNSTPLRPGVTITRGFSDNAPPYTMGGALWFYDPNYNNGEGQWYNLEWGNFENTTGWGYWDTIKTGQFAGIYKFETVLSNHPGADMTSKIAGINFGNNGNIGAPQTIVLTKTDLGDPNSLPINIDISPQAYEYLKNRAGQNVASGANYDLYNWILKTYNNMPAAEWYLKTGKTEGNPYLPGGAYVPKADAGETVPDETEIAGLTRYDAEVLIDIIKGKGKSQTRINAINQMKKHRPDILKHLSNLGYV